METQSRCVCTGLRALLIRVTLLLAAAVAAQPVQASTIDPVFDDQLAEQWHAAYWDCAGNLMSGCSSLTESDVVHSGQHAIRVHHCCPGGWGAFGFDRREPDWTRQYWMYPNQYRQVRLFFNPGPSMEGADELQVTLDNGSPGVDLIAYLDGPLAADTWHEVVIPMTALDTEGGRFFRLYFFNSSDLQPQYYLDDVSLEWIADGEPPVISELTVNDVTFEAARISWTTDEYTICSLGYGIGEPATVIDEDDYSTSHEVALTGLAPSTTYLFEIIASDHQVADDALPNTTRATGQLTTAPPDTTPPLLSGVQVTGIRSNRVTITWDSDEPADSRVSYGIGSYDKETDQSTPTREHRVALTGLEPETTYQFRVASQDLSGNLAVYETAPPMTFTTTELASATLTVDAGRQLRPFTAAIRGVNLGNWTFFWGRPYPNDSAKLRELTRLIRPGVLRYAGGLWSNNVTWDRHNSQCYPGSWVEDRWCDRRPFNPWQDGDDRCQEPEQRVEGAYHHAYQADEIDALASFADYVGAEVMIEVDITTCDPQLWADMVRYTNVENDYGFTYWELGNELDLKNADQSADDIPVAGEYVRRYKEYYRAMKAVDDSIRIAGPATAAHEDDAYFRAFTDYIDPLTQDAEVLGSQMLDLLTYHHYPFWHHAGGEITWQDLAAFTYDPERRSRAHINHCAADKRTLLDSRGFPDTLIGVTEFNAMAADATSSLVFNHAQALYMADTLARQAAAGADMVLHWELYDRPYDYQESEVDTSYGLINQNHSSASRNASGDIVIDDQFTVMPVYYTYLMYGQLFGDLLVEAASSQEETLSVWASTDSAEPGTIKLMVVNLSPEAYETRLIVDGLGPSTGTFFVLENPEFSAAADKTSVIDGTFLNGLQLDCSSAASIVSSAAAILASGRPLQRAAGGNGEAFLHVFPAYTATVVHLRQHHSGDHPRQPDGRRR